MDPEALAVIIVPMMVFGIPIAAILTSHQRKMAELIHGKQDGHAVSQTLLAEIQSLRAELHALRSQVYEQALIVDDLRPLANQSPPPLEHRLGGEQ